MKKKFLIFMAMFTPFLAPNSHAVSADNVASDFFEQYQKYWKNFNPELKNLFADDAKIVSTSYGDGVEVIYKMTGQKLKERLDDILKYQKARNNYDAFSQIQIQKLAQNRYQINAERYDLDKCYEDKAFTITIEQQANQSFKIIALEDSTIEVSKCTTPLKQDIPAKLQIAAIAANKELPKQIDRITVLEKITADKNTLSYHYRLDDVVDTDLLTDKMLMEYEDSVTNTTCENKQLKEELDSGVELQHLTYDSQNQLIFNYTVNKIVCDSYEQNK